MASPLIFHHIPGSTLLHRLDPRWKLFAYLFVSLLAMRGPILHLGILALVTGVLYIWIRLHPLTVLREAIPLWTLAALLLIFRTLSVGMENGILETARFAFLVFWTHLFLASTSTREIRKAAEFLFSFLPQRQGKRIGLALSITLLFFPLLLDLSREILHAMALRRFGSRRSFPFLTKRFMITFLRKAFRLARNLAHALELRGFR